MDDIFIACKKNDVHYVREWLKNTEHDPNAGDEHDFTALHWASWFGRMEMLEMLLKRGAKVHAVNMGEDTALHCAAQHNHKHVIVKLIKNGADVNVFNVHGATPLHYACFWGHDECAKELVNSGANVSLCNKYGQTPLELARTSLREDLRMLAEKTRQNVTRIDFDRIASSDGFTTIKSKPNDVTAARFGEGIEVADVSRRSRVAVIPNGEIHHGQLAGKEILLRVIIPTPRDEETLKRIQRDFKAECKKLRIFSHANIHPVLTYINDWEEQTVISELLRNGNLHDVLHNRSDVRIDVQHAARFARDICRGMVYLHQLEKEKSITSYNLSSKTVVIDDDSAAKINLADCKFSFEDVGQIYNPEWMAPEMLGPTKGSNLQAAHMWSFAVILWELVTRQVPFPDMNKMEIGAKIAMEQMRLPLPQPSGPTAHLTKMMKLGMAEDPSKRPTFERILPLLEKMTK